MLYLLVAGCLALTVLLLTAREHPDSGYGLMGAARWQVKADPEGSSRRASFLQPKHVAAEDLPASGGERIFASRQPDGLPGGRAVRVDATVTLSSSLDNSEGDSSGVVKSNPLGLYFTKDIKSKPSAQLEALSSAANQRAASGARGMHPLGFYFSKKGAAQEAGSSATGAGASEQQGQPSSSADANDAASSSMKPQQATSRDGSIAGTTAGLLAGGQQHGSSLQSSSGSARAGQLGAQSSGSSAGASAASSRQVSGVAGSTGQRERAAQALGQAGTATALRGQQQLRQQQQQQQQQPEQQQQQQQQLQQQQQSDAKQAQRGAPPGGEEERARNPLGHYFSQGGGGAVAGAKLASGAAVAKALEVADSAEADAGKPKMGYYFSKDIPKVVKKPGNPAGGGVAVRGQR